MLSDYKPPICASIDISLIPVQCLDINHQSAQSGTRKVHVHDARAESGTSTKEPQYGLYLSRSRLTFRPLSAEGEKSAGNETRFIYIEVAIGLAGNG